MPIAGQIIDSAIHYDNKDVSCTCMFHWRLQDDIPTIDWVLSAAADFADTIADSFTQFIGEEQEVRSIDMIAPEDMMTPTVNVPFSTKGGTLFPDDSMPSHCCYRIDRYGVGAGNTPLHNWNWISGVPMADSDGGWLSQSITASILSAVLALDNSAPIGGGSVLSPVVLRRIVIPNEPDQLFFGASNSRTCRPNARTIKSRLR